jgi:predicted nucleic acid-binding protein
MLPDIVLVDAGALIAFYNVRDPAHRACLEAAKQLPVGKAYTCWPGLTEAAYLLRKYRDQRALLFDAIYNGEFSLLTLTNDDLPSIQEVFSTYHDADVDLADATLVHLGNREGIETIFTTDRRHFGMYRLQSGRSFRILPEQ